MLESLSTDAFDSRTPTGSHYFRIIYCLKEQRERQTASSHVRDCQTGQRIDCNGEKVTSGWRPGSGLDYPLAVLTEVLPNCL